MAHRGRLNVLAHVLRLPYAQIMAEFEGERAADVATRAPSDGTGDVKYHYGASNRRQMQVGPDEVRDVHVTLAAEPVATWSSSNPVVMGMHARAADGLRAPASTVRDPRGGLARPDPRRRVVRRPGRRRRDAEPAVAARLPHRRHAAPHRQQPGRLHHRPGRTRARRATRQRPGEGLRRPDRPRQRRRPRGLPGRGPDWRWRSARASHATS